MATKEEYGRLHIPPMPTTSTGWKPKKQPWEDMLNYQNPNGGTKAETPQQPAITPVEDEEEDDNLAAYQKMVAEYATPPLTPEEEERRVKAATAAQGWGALGNGLNAMSNLFFVGGVAPSQKLPDLYDANKDIQQFRDRIMKNRAAYLANYKALSDLSYKNKALAGKNVDRRLRERAIENDSRRIAANEKRYEEIARHNQEMERLISERQKADEDYKNHLIDIKEYQARIQGINARTNALRAQMQYGGSTTVTNVKYFYDPTGEKTGESRTVTETPNSQAGAGGGSHSSPQGGNTSVQNNDNTPPTRRNNNDNTPPTRRKK